MNEIDGSWGKINQKVLKERGTRTYKVTEIQARQIAKSALQNLGFTLVDSAMPSLVSASALTPKPFSDEEFVKIRRVEEPMMQTMASTHVGNFTSSFFYLTSGKNDVIIDIALRPIESDKTELSLNFRLRYINPSSIVIYGTNPPPEAVRLGIEKWWSAFEAELSKVQPSGS
jgi:hypothetical protein